MLRISSNYNIFYKLVNYYQSMKNITRYIGLIFIAGYLMSVPVYSQKKLPAKQLMVVLTNNWGEVQGKLYCFGKRHGKWVLAFSNAVVVGAKGLGTGDGLFPFAINSAPIKKEGDNKSPAGIFTIGSAFGYAPCDNAMFIKTHYVKANDTLICVDDVNSVHYNTLVSTDTTTADWHSHEEMHLKSNQYKWGLFVNHNAAEPVPGDGSCIFMHIWRNNHEGTAGCTAMTETDILRVLHWINAADKPVLVQFPKTVYTKIRARFGLPPIRS